MDRGMRKREREEGIGKYGWEEGKRMEKRVRVRNEIAGKRDIRKEGVKRE